MERGREGRRPKTAAGNGPPSSRQHGTAGLRDSPVVEDGEVEFQETVRMRDRANSNKHGVPEDSTEESVRGGEDETEKRGSRSYHNQRKILLSARAASPATMTVDKIIGVSVPRKARSCSAKKSHEHFVSRYVSTSAVGLNCEEASPPSSNAPVGKKMKGTLNVSKSSTSSQEDFEIEIAEVLYGLRKQSQSSKKECSAPNPSLKLDDKIEQLSMRQTSIPKFMVGSEELDMEVIKQATAMSMELHMEVVKQDNPRTLTIEIGNRDGMGSNKTFITAKEESHWCPKFDIDLQDSAMAKGSSTLLENKNQEEKIRINMKAPAMASSPERDSLVDLGLGPDLKAQNGNMKKGNSTEEKLAVKVQNAKMEERNHGPDGDNVGRRELEQGHRKQQRRAVSTHHQEEKTVQPSSSSLTNIVPGWANSVLPVGYIPIDGNNGTSKALQPPHFPLSQPRTSRCTTHQYIARNIYLHQQFIGMNKLWPAPAPAASASIYGATPCNLNLMLPSTPSQGSPMASHVKSTNGAKTFPGHAGKDRSSEGTNPTDNADRKQAAFQQTPQPAPAGSLPHGPAFFFPLSQNQASVSTSAAQSGLSRSAISINNASSSSSNSASTAPVTSTPLPPVAATMTFNYPKIAANEAPSLAILQNNGFLLPISTPLGAAPAFHPQAMSFFNGSFYSPQMFHPSQQQPHPQPVVLSASTGSSSSHKKPQLDAPSNRSDASGNNSGKHVEKQRQQPQQLSSNRGGELNPQAFTVSFTSNGNTTAASNINFSSMAQGYQVMAAAQMAHQKNYQISAAGKTGKDTTHPESGRKAVPAKTIPITGQTLMYDNSARVLNFVSPPGIRNWPWPPCSITSAPVSQIAANPPNYQQQQLLHLQKHDTMHQPPTSRIFSGTPSQWKNPARKQAPSVPNIASSSSGSTSKFHGKRGRNQEGQNQISFEGTSVAEAPHKDGLRIASMSDKDGSSTPTLQSQQTDNASKAAKKSSPGCRRNLPSILGTGPGHTSQIKY